MWCQWAFNLAVLVVVLVLVVDVDGGGGDIMGTIVAIQVADGTAARRERKMSRSEIVQVRFKLRIT